MYRAADTMKCILTILIFISLNASAKTFHVSAAGSDFTTLSQVQNAGNNGTIKSGDSVLFKNGETFTGNIYWATIFGGKCPSNVYFGTYGSGAKAYFEVSGSHNLFSFVGVNNITIDGFSIGEKSFPVNDKTNPPNCQLAFIIGADAPSNNCTISNCDITNVGGGFVITGQFNTVKGCKITDLKTIKNTYGAPGSNAADDDYGANGVTFVYGDDNLITNNVFTGNWSNSYDYGWDGGAIEMFQSCSRNRVVYNTIIDCDGVAEFGAYVSSTLSADNLFAYNLIINSGQLSWCNLGGSYATNVTNVQYFNNTIITNSDTRFTGESECFAYNGSPAATVYNLKNNLFILSTGLNVVRSSSAAKTSHTNNIYQLSNGSKANYTLGSSEINTTATLFDANYYPLPNSPVINFGIAVGIALDYAGNAITGKPDAGIKEYVTSSASQTQVITVAGWNAVVTLPANYNANMKYPTLVFFPGTGEV
ncbi:MAG: hypothetical protein ABI091_02185, partial [Ferruginibacter sp.]